MKDKVWQKNRAVHRRSADNGLFKSGFPKGIVHCCAVGLLFSVILGVFLALVMSWIICETDDPARYVTPTALIALYVPAFFGGFAAAVLNKKSALLCGLGVGVMLVALMFIASLLISNTLSGENGVISAVALRMAVLVSSILGAFVGITKKSSRKKCAKKHKKR